MEKKSDISESRTRASHDKYISHIYAIPLSHEGIKRCLNYCYKTSVDGNISHNVSHNA